MSRTFTFLLVLLVSLICACIFWLSTQWGPGTSPDSIAYMLTARKINSLESIFLINKHWPPLYPLVIAMTNSITGDLLASTRLIQLSTYIANIWLFYLLIDIRQLEKNAIKLFATVCFGLSTTIYYVHFTALSEGLFFTFLLLHFVGFREFLRKTPPETIIKLGVRLVVFVVVI